MLHTARLILARCTPQDRAAFVALEQDPDVMRFLNGGVPVDRATADPDIPFLMPDGTEPHVWTARRQNGAFVGWFCLWPEGDGSAELGYRLQRAEWGQGLATEGAEALVAWGFDVAGYDRITACTMAVNHASRRVMEKVGMTHLRTEKGDVWYEITQP